MTGDKPYKSYFEKFFVLQDGVISLSLRDMTLFSCIAISASLLGMLYISCTNELVECSLDLLPMISDVICLPYFDRIFCILTCFFTMAVHQVNARAFYKKLDGIASPETNDLLLILALISCVSLPAIGFFDEHLYKTIHGVSAALFFGSTGFYAFIIGGVMAKNKDKFPENGNEIDRMNQMKWAMLGTLLTFGISVGVWGSNFWLTPLSEWAITLIYVNYFAVLVFTSQYYDSIHPYGKLVKQ